MRSTVRSSAKSRTTTRTRRWAVLGSFLGVALAVSGCGGATPDAPADPASPDTDRTDDSGADRPNDVKLAQSSSPWPGGINAVVSPFMFADDFGLHLNLDQLETFSSSTTSRQVMMSGGLDATSGSFIGGVQMIESGQSVKFFCPGTTGYTALVLGVGDIQALTDIDPETTPVSIEPPGGPSNLFMDLVFRSQDLDFRTSDFKNTVVLDDSPLRLSALIRGDAKVAIIDVEMLPELQSALGEDQVHVLSDVMADVGGDALFNGFMATTDWLDANPDVAAQLCATILKGNQALNADFDLFRDVNMQYLDYDVTEDELRFTWEDIARYGIFPESSEGLGKDRVNAVIEASLESGVLSDDVRNLAYEDIVAVDILQKADELLAADDGDLSNPVY